MATADCLGLIPKFSRSTLEYSWQVWLSLPGDCLAGRDRDDCRRLWLLLGDGRVLVFRLGRSVFPDNALATAVALALAEDKRGDVLELEMKEMGWVGILYGAPASPVFCVDPANPAFAKALAFHACLDGALLTLLAGLAGTNHFWGSARNYSRLNIHARRNERLQALQRYPLLVPPILLTHQRWPNLSDCKRFRWRAHDDAVVEAIDHGQDLTGALAAYYGISRGLVRSPFCAQAWSGSSGRTLPDFLQFLDAIPAHRRPLSGAEIDTYAHHLPALWGLFGGIVQIAARAFHEGFGIVWRRLEQRFDSPEMPLNVVIIDTEDYLRVLAAWLRTTHRRRLAPTQIADIWARQRGLASLLAASLRWHARIPRSKSGGKTLLPDSVPAIIGDWSDNEWSARELSQSEALHDEGAAMHHCIGDYWPDSVLKGHRAFAFTYRELPPSGDERLERATAWYELDTASGHPVYAFAQIRGMANAVVNDPMQVFAKRFEDVLNTPERVAERQAAWRFTQKGGGNDGSEDKLAARIDPESITVLNALLDLPRTKPIGDDGSQYMPVAGYAYAFDAAREAKFANGQPLKLVREPDNPFDALAVRVDWEGQKIGYVPRPQNVGVAGQLDQGQTLVAQICRFVPQASMWERLWLRIEGYVITDYWSITKLSESIG